MKRALLMMLGTGLLAMGVSGCASSDACDGLSTCLAVTAMPIGGATINIDQLVVTLSGNVNGTRTVPNKPAPATLPQTVALEFVPPGGYMGQFAFDISVVAYKAGSVVANGTQHATLTTTMHQAATVMMSMGAPTMTVTDMAGGGSVTDMAPAPLHD